MLRCLDKIWRPFSKFTCRAFYRWRRNQPKGKPFKGKGGNEVIWQMKKFEIVRQQIPLISEHLRFLSLKESDGFIGKYGQILNEFEEKLISENESVEYAEC